MHTANCKPACSLGVSTDRALSSCRGQILDPAHTQPSSAYAESRASGSGITVLANNELASDSAIAKFFTLNTAVELLPPAAPW